MRGDRQEKHISFGIHARAEPPQSVCQSGYARERSALQVALIVDQQHASQARVISLAEHSRRQADLLCEPLLLADAGETEKERLAVRRSVAGDRGERLIDAARL